MVGAATHTPAEMTPEEFDTATEDLRPLLSERLGVRARSPLRGLKRAGRLLPARARHASAELEHLRARLDHPKLAYRTDPRHVARAAGTIRTALGRHRPGQRVDRQRALLWGELGFRAFVTLGAGLMAAHYLMPTLP